MLAVADFRCLVVKAVLGISTITSCLAQGVPVSTGNLQGTVVSDLGAAVAGATVSVYPFIGPSRFTSRAVTSTTGGFTLNGIPADRYRVCVRTGAGFADSCQWGIPRLLVDVPAAPGTPPIIIRLKKTAVLKVRLNDTGTFLSPLPSEKFPPHVLIGVMGAVTFLPAHPVRKDSTGVDYELAVPVDTPLRFRVYSRLVQLQLAGNNPVLPQGYSTVLFFDSSKPVPPPLVLSAVGRIP